MIKIINSVNDYLRKFPRIRNFIITAIKYNLLFASTIINLIKRRKQGFFTQGRILTPDNENCYFGYYDKTPYSRDSKYIIYHSIPTMKAPETSEFATIYIQSLRDGTRKKLGETFAWNLQQGAMLRFYGDQIVAWNDFRDNTYCSVFYNLEDDHEKIINYPLYDITRDGSLGLTLDFERLNVDAEGYGYIQLGKKDFSRNAWIKIVNIKTEEVIALIETKKLHQLFPVPQAHSVADFFYFNHLNFNPSGTRFLFIERYLVGGKRISRLFSANSDGTDIHLLVHEEMVSHFTWKDDNTILVYCRHNNQNRYFVITDTNNTNFSSLEDSHLLVDGHPTYDINKSFFVSDTYPDKARKRHLFIYNVVKKQYKELASLGAPIKYDGPNRCDFHPRFRPDYQAVCIDSIHEGHRGIYEVNL